MHVSNMLELGNISHCTIVPATVTNEFLNILKNKNIHFIAELSLHSDPCVLFYTTKIFPDF